MDESLRELLSSATTNQSPSPQSNEFGKSLLLNGLTKGSNAPSPSILRKPSAALTKSPGQDAQIACQDLVSLHMPISNFKPILERDFCPQLVSANDKFIAYVVGKKKVRLLDQINGQKGMMENQKDSSSSIVAVALKGDTLASLTEGGELLIGTVYAESKESLGFDPIVSLTFPDLLPSRGIVWSSGDHRVLAAYGRNPAAFMVWLEPKPSAVEIPHSLNGHIEAVTFFGQGKYVAVADSSAVECFEIDHVGRNFTKIAQFAYGPQVNCRRVLLFEDGENDFVIAAIDGNSGAFIACPVNIGKNLGWIVSSLVIPSAIADNVAICYDSLLQVFIVDSRTDGTFHVLGFRSDSPAFAHINGRWREALPVHSIALCAGLRNVEAGIHVPLYIFQSEWVSFYGLKLPSDPQPMKPAQVNAAPRETPSKLPKTKPVAAILSEAPSPAPLAAPASPAPMAAPASPAAGFNLDEKVCEIVKSMMVKHLIPSLEASFNEMFKQVKDHLLTITSANNNALESKIDQLTMAVNEIGKAIAQLPSAQQLAEVISPHQSSADLQEESFDDLMKKELDEMIKTSPVGALFRALELGNLPLLTWLLRRLDPMTIIEALPAPALLSLIQQLGADLSDETELKLDWLAEIFTAYSPKSDDPNFANTASQVLEELFSNLRVLLAQLPASSELLKKLKTVMRLVRLVL